VRVGHATGRGEERGASSERRRWGARRRGSKERESGAWSGRIGGRPSGVSEWCLNENKRWRESKLWCTSERSLFGFDN
jgi:hypothetical protein